MLARLVEQPCVGSIKHSFGEITAPTASVTEPLFILAAYPPICSGKVTNSDDFIILTND